MSTAHLPVTDRRLHVAAKHHNRALPAAQAVAHAFLAALGFDLDQEALAETPARMAKAYIELLSSREFDLTTFPNDESYEQLVLVQRIPFRSLCEHHALPFIGTADIGYLPDKRIIGLSKLARVVELFTHRAQVQERMTKHLPKVAGVSFRCWLCQGASMSDGGPACRRRNEAGPPSFIPEPRGAQLWTHTSQDGADPRQAVIKRLLLISPSNRSLGGRRLDSLLMSDWVRLMFFIGRSSLTLPPAPVGSRSASICMSDGFTPRLLPASLRFWTLWLPTPVPMPRSSDTTLRT